MKRMVIAVDCDDVVVETVPAILGWYNTCFGTTIHPSDYYGSDISVWGVADRDVAIRRVNEYLQTDEYANLPPIAEAMEVLDWLSRHHELHLVTGRADFLEEATSRWIDEHFPGIFTSLEFTNYIVPSERKHVTRSKVEVCTQLQADLLIDDHLHHATEVAKADIPVLLFGDYDWNRTDSLPTGITRAADWEGVRAYFE